jgi:hypothetical protein
MLCFFVRFSIPYHTLDQTDQKNKKSVKNEQKMGKIEQIQIKFFFWE